MGHGKSNLRGRCRKTIGRLVCLCIRPLGLSNHLYSWGMSCKSSRRAVSKRPKATCVYKVDDASTTQAQRLANPGVPLAHCLRQRYRRCKSHSSPCARGPTCTGSRHCRPYTTRESPRLLLRSGVKVSSPLRARKL